MKILEYSSLFWGLGVLIVTFLPFVLYVKYFFFQKDSYNQKTFWEKVVGVFLLQLFLFTIFWLTAKITTNLINSSSQLLPCYGIRIFFFNNHTSCNITINGANKHFWNLWNYYAHKKMPNTINPIYSTYIGVGKLLYIISQFVFIFLFFLFLSIFVIPFYIIAKQIITNKQNNDIPEPITNIIFKSIITGIILYFLIKVHLSIGTQLVKSIGNVNNFSFYNEMVSIMRYVFLGN